MHVSPLLFSVPSVVSYNLVSGTVELEHKWHPALYWKTWHWSQQHGYPLCRELNMTQILPLHCELLHSKLWWTQYINSKHMNFKCIFLINSWMAANNSQASAAAVSWLNGVHRYKSSAHPHTWQVPRCDHKRTAFLTHIVCCGGSSCLSTWLT